MEAVNASREPNFLLAKLEKKLLVKMAGKLPGWILPDDLTLLGVFSAMGICVSYALSNNSKAWLWIASGLLVVHWIGDSLDGTLARVRKIQRPKYGYYLDHLVDAISTALIGIGLGLSPYMLLSIGLIITVLYLILSINVYLESYALGRFSIGYSLIGPTEMRLILIMVNIALALSVPLKFEALGLHLSALDIIGLSASLLMLVALMLRAWGNLKSLAREEPAAPRS